MYISTYKMYLLWVAKKSLALIFNPKFPSLHKSRVNIPSPPRH